MTADQRELIVSKLREASQLMTVGANLMREVQSEMERAGCQLPLPQIVDISAFAARSAVNQSRLVELGE